MTLSSTISLEENTDLSTSHQRLFSGDLKALLAEKIENRHQSLKEDLVRQLLLEQGLIDECMDTWPHDFTGYDFALLYSDIDKHKAVLTEHGKPEELKHSRGDGFPALKGDEIELQVHAYLLKHFPKDEEHTRDRIKINSPSGIDEATYLAVSACFIFSEDAFPAKLSEKGYRKSPYNNEVMSVLSDIRTEVHEGPSPMIFPSYNPDHYLEHPGSDKNVHHIRPASFKEMRWLQLNHNPLLRQILEAEAFGDAVEARHPYDDLCRYVENIKRTHCNWSSLDVPKLEAISKEIAERTEQHVEETFGQHYREKLAKAIAPIKEDADVVRMLKYI